MGSLTFFWYLPKYWYQISALPWNHRNIFLFLENKHVYGRIVTSFIRERGQNDIMVSVNNFLTGDEVTNMVHGSLIPTTISSQFIAVKDLFQSTIVHDIPVGHIHSVIFVFKTAIFEIKLYECCSNIFCLCYQLTMDSDFRNKRE